MELQIQTSLPINRLIEAIKALPPEEQTGDLDPVHLFAPGIYVRVLYMPAGSTIVSKIHKTEHFCMAVSGKATVVIGNSTEDIVGPRLMKTMPGTQRALYIHEDSIWITFHPTKETELDKIETELIAEDFNDTTLIEYHNKQKTIENKENIL